MNIREVAVTVWAISRLLKSNHGCIMSAGAVSNCTSTMAEHARNGSRVVRVAALAANVLGAVQVGAPKENGGSAEGRGRGRPDGAVAASPKTPDADAAPACRTSPFPGKHVAARPAASAAGQAIRHRRYGPVRDGGRTGGQRGREAFPGAGAVHAVTGHNTHNVRPLQGRSEARILDGAKQAADSRHVPRCLCIRGIVPGLQRSLVAQERVDGDKTQDRVPGTRLLHHAARCVRADRGKPPGL